jgi:hypothetical protein
LEWQRSEVERVAPETADWMVRCLRVRFMRAHVRAGILLEQVELTLLFDNAQAAEAVAEFSTNTLLQVMIR